MKNILLLLLLLSGFSFAADAQREAVEVPSEVAPFVEKGTRAIALEKGDLNGDRKEDFILVLEKENTEKDEYDFPKNQRPLLILIRQADNSLKLTKRNEKIIMCSECGGIFGDPFEGIIIKRNSFSAHMYGGSAWRWAYNYQFNYSRRDDTWQLVRVQQISYHTSDPNKMDTKIYTPPRSYGKIDIADFDPENFKGKGAK